MIFIRRIIRRMSLSTTATTSKSATSLADVQQTKPRRQFDFTLWNKRHVAFRVAYVGCDYSGLAIQESTNNTIEGKLFECLMKTYLVEDYHSCNYSRCGRTDSGVSALGQVISLDVRSALLEGPGVIVTENSKAKERKGDKSVELSYLELLNRILPPNIRILSWAPVDPSFSARFHALSRVYKYYFPIGAMNIHAMKEAAKKFIGTHDFRNFCKVDIRDGIVKFERTINDVTIEPIDDNDKSPYGVYECTVSSKGFLRHQIRCMMSVLFLIGNGLEEPQVIDHMLDMTKCPGKPPYGMAADYPLILYDCVFDGINWITDEYNDRKILCQLQEQWTKQMMQATMIKRMLDSLTSAHEAPPTIKETPPTIEETPPTHQIAPIIKSVYKLGCSYKPLLTRPPCDNFETRYELHQAKKRKIEQQEEDKI